MVWTFTFWSNPIFLGVPARLGQFLGFLAHILLTTSHTFTSLAGRGHHFLWTLFHLNCLHQLFILCSEDEVGLSVYLASFSLSIVFGTFTYFVRNVITDRCSHFKKSKLTHEMAHMSWCLTRQIQLVLPRHARTHQNLFYPNMALTSCLGMWVFCLLCSGRIPIFGYVSVMHFAHAHLQESRGSWL